LDIKLIDAASSRPKYRQIIENVKLMVKEGILAKGDNVPSINALCREYGISRDTAVKAYDELKASNVLGSVHGKGFFVLSAQISCKYKVLLFMDEMNMYKENIYQALLERLGDDCNIDICFHHNNPEIAGSFLDSVSGRYKYFVFIPFFDEAQSKALLKKYSGCKIILADRDIPETGLPVVCQDFYSGSLGALEKAAGLLKKYRKFNLVLSEKNNQVMSHIEKSFVDFCLKHDMNHEVLDVLNLKKGEAYWLINDALLVQCVREARSKNYTLGRDIGLLSYNDTPFKDILENGITVVSTDFSLMGHRIADVIISGEGGKTIIPTELIARKSL